MAEILRVPVLTSGSDIEAAIAAALSASSYTDPIIQGVAYNKSAGELVYTIIENPNGSPAATVESAVNLGTVSATDSVDIDLSLGNNFIVVADFGSVGTLTINAPTNEPSATGRQGFTIYIKNTNATPGSLNMAVNSAYKFTNGQVAPASSPFGTQNEMMQIDVDAVYIDGAIAYHARYGIVKL